MPDVVFFRLTTCAFRISARESVVLESLQWRLATSYTTKQQKIDPVRHNSQKIVWGRLWLSASKYQLENSNQTISQVVLKPLESRV